MFGEALNTTVLPKDCQQLTTLVNDAKVWV